MRKKFQKPRIRKPILCLDFDGVMHSYTSGWKGAATIPDPPVPGLFDFLNAVAPTWEIHVFSSRSHQPGGIRAMMAWYSKHFSEWKKAGGVQTAIIEISYPETKPSATVSIDDRGFRFEGAWPSLDMINSLKTPWNRQVHAPASEGGESTPAPPLDIDALSASFSGDEPLDLSKDVVYLFFGHGDSDLCCQPENGDEGDRVFTKADGDGVAVFRITAPGGEGLQIVGKYSSAEWIVIHEPLELGSPVPLWSMKSEPGDSDYTNVLMVTVPEDAVVEPYQGGAHHV